MIKKEIYPKTKRISEMNVEITEKLDGSNLCIFKKDNILHIAQRRTIINFYELEEYKNLLYKGLYQWLQDNKNELNTVNDNSVVCGEWLGMGKLKYDFDKKYYMFAKANIDDDFNLYNIYYDHDLFIYPFSDGIIPDCIGVVPLIGKVKVIPNISILNSMYESYTKHVKRNVEGFVINYNNNIQKYVRMKNGKLEEHHE